MTQAQEIKLILDRMSELLRLSTFHDWANGFDELSHKVLDTPDETKRQILSLYGGMGSLNDLVLYKDGHVLTRENDEFDTLRSHLFELSH